MKKRILSCMFSLALCLCMVLFLLPVAGNAADVATLPRRLYVGGITVVEEYTAGAVTSGEGWRYDVDTATLYLTDGANICYTSTTEDQLENGIYCSGGTLKIHASGTVSITGFGDGIKLPDGGLDLYAAEGANVTITGTSEGSEGINSTINTNSVRFSGKGTVNVNATQGAAYGVTAAGDIIIDGVTLNARGTANFDDISGNNVLIGQTEAAVVNCLGTTCSGIGGTLTQKVGIYNGSTVHMREKVSGKSWLVGIHARTLEIVDSTVIMDGLTGTYSIYAMHSTSTVSGNSHILIRKIVSTDNDACGLTTGSAGYELTAAQDYYIRTDPAGEFACNAEVQELYIDYFELYTPSHHGYHSNGDGTHYYGCPNACPAAIKGEEETCGGTATCTEPAVCDICKESYGSPDAYNHVGGFTAEFTWYDPDEGECYVGATLYCGACGESADHNSGYGKLTGRVVATDCLNPGSDTYEVTLELNGKEYSDSHTVETISEKHVAEPVNGFCSACGGCEAAVWNEDEGVYEISNAGQLYWYARYLNTENAEVRAKLTADIVIPENAPNWEPINASYVYFDGNFHTISGLKCIGGDMTYVGMFGLEGWWYEISNLHIDGSYFEGKEYVGALVACMSNGGSITNCAVTDTTVKGESYKVGGLVGNLSTSHAVNCFSTATVIGDEGKVLIGSYTSGYGSIENCCFLGTEDDFEGTTAMTAGDFASGKVAYLLQAGVKGAEIYDDDWNLIGYEEGEHIWGQNIGKDAYPVLKGAKVYQVTNCKAETAYSNTNENGAHSYADGVCTVCGEAEPINRFNFAGSSMTLGNTLEINVALKLSDVTGEDNYIVVSKEYADGREDVTRTYPQSQWTKQGAVAYVSFTVSAKEMNDQLTVIAYNGAGQQISNPYKDSVAGYCLRMLQKEEIKASPSARHMTLYVDMLNYGAAAQTKWEYNTDAMANAGLTDAQKAYATVVTEKENILQKGEGYLGTSLSLKENILMNVAFRNTFLANVKYAVVTFVNHNGEDESVTVAIEDFVAQGSSVKYVSLECMAVADYAQSVTITLYNAADEAISTTVDSMEGYVVRQLEKGADVELYEAILAFGKGAYNYFHY